MHSGFKKYSDSVSQTLWINLAVCPHVHLIIYNRNLIKMNSLDLCADVPQGLIPAF